MLRGGLVSITFRSLTAEEIIKLVLKSNLECIEWGGDIHVPHGDIKQAKNVRRMTCDSGLRVASYGSYYRVGESENKGLTFKKVLETARELGAPIIRVWAGGQGSLDADGSYWEKIIDDSLRIAEMSSSAGIKIAYEYHANTLSDTNKSARSLLEKTNSSEIGIYWQPPVGKDIDYCSEGLKDILFKLLIVHIFHWSLGNAGLIRQPLSNGYDCWFQYMNIIKTKIQDIDLLIEFVKQDSPEQFLEDSLALNAWLEK
jgi:hypothetical protein